MKRDDDVVLIRKILSGDDAAFNILVEKYQESIHALAWRKIQDFHYAEDIMQDTFLKAYNKLPTLKNPNQFAGWIHTIATHLCIDWIRKHKPEIQSLECMRTEEIEESSYSRYMSEQRVIERTEYSHELVNKLLDSLPENERKVITLYYLDEMSTKEIGEFMGVSVNTITSRLQRARKRLQTDQGLLNREFFGHLLLSDNLKENIMSQFEELRNKFNSFMEQAKSDPASKEDILKEADREVDTALKGGISSELVHLAVDGLYPYMGKLGMEKRVPLLRKYMNDVEDVAERFWSHKSLVSALAILRNNREAIEEQTSLYHWSCKHAEKYMLRIVSDLNIARCWKEEGRIDDWIQLYNEASEQLKKPEVSAYSRCYFLQIGAEILRVNDRFNEALLEIEKLELALDEPSWEHYFRFWLAARTNRLLLYSKMGEWVLYNQVYIELNTYIRLELKKLAANFPINKFELFCASHNIGCCLIWSKKYKKAKRFLQIAIDLDDWNEHSYFMLAVSIWASEKDRGKAINYIKIAQDKFVVNTLNYPDSLYPTFLETPEFSDVKDDPEFLKVFGKESSIGNV